MASVSVIVSDPEVKLVARLVDVNNNPLPGKPVSFYYRKTGEEQWKLIGTRYTDSSGEACSSVSLGSGTYDFRAVFPGNNVYEPSEAEVNNVYISAPPKKHGVPWWAILLALLAIILLMLR